jgi:hypothetical protein
MLITTSSSSFVNGGPLLGAHVYILTLDARTNPEVLKILHTASIARKLGRYKVSAHGTLLQRSIVDMALKTACQPIFEGMCKHDKGIKIDRRVELFPGRVLDPEDLDCVEEDIERVEEIMENWKNDAAIQEEMRIKKEEWISKRISEGCSAEEARLISAQAHTEKKVYLPLGFSITFDDGKVVSIRDMIRNPKLYNNKTCRDPFDPDDGVGKAIVYLSTDSPVIHSFSHGERNYYLPDTEILVMNEMKAVGDDNDERIDVLEKWAEKIAQLSESRQIKLKERLKSHKITKGLFSTIIQQARKSDSKNTKKDTEIGVAELFAEKFKDIVRYDHNEGAWFFFNKIWWEKETKGQVFYRMKELAKESASSDPSILRHSFVNGAVKIAKNERCLSIHGDNWNPYPHLLGTPEGAVDLRKGVLREPNNMDMITQVTNFSPGEGEATQWKKFLGEIMQDEGIGISFKIFQLLFKTSIKGRKSAMVDCPFMQKPHNVSTVPSSLFKVTA